MSTAYLCLGSNQGDRIGYIQQAASLLKGTGGISIVTTSSFYETEPWGMESENLFVNAVMQISTTLSPEELLKAIKFIEKTLGRVDDTPKGELYTDRCIDIDIIFYDNKVINKPDLIIPHQFFHKRAFMIVPMLEIAQDFVHPLYNKTVSKLYDELENPEMVCLYGTRL